MRKLAVVFLALIALPALADSEHLQHLRMMMHAMSQHGPVIPQPESINTQAAVAINITARSFNFSPSDITVNQGDVVTLTVTVPASDPSTIGHGVLMDEYIPNGINCGRGKTVSTTFVATTAGEFPFVCTQPSCGTGHTSMVGQLVVNAAPQGPTIASISPNSGPTSGGTTVTISGTGFQPGATVAFGAVAATNVNVTSSTSITATTPLGPTSEQLIVDVVVTNPDGTSATLHPGFTYSVPSLAVTAILPGNGLAGTFVTITGVGFTNAVVSSVTFGGVPATNVRIVDPVTISFTAPPHAVGTVDVALTIGQSTITKSFTYDTPPARHYAVRH